MPGKITVLGSINTDLVTRVDRIPGTGETIQGRDFREISGGKGANQAIAVSRAGGEVAMVGCVGDDAFGAQQIKNLQREGISTAHVGVAAGTATGTAVIFVEDSGENRIVVVSGANGKVNRKKVDTAVDTIAATDFLICQLEIPLDAVERAASLASEFGTYFILNPAPVAPLRNELFAKIDCLIPNELEASQLTGVVVFDADTAEEAAMHLLGKGTRNVVVTLGAGGVLACNRHGSRFVEAVAVSPVDTTAAGDTFIGFFAAHLAEGQDLFAAVEQAQYAAALSVTRFGAQTSIPTKGETVAFMDKM